MKFPFLAGIVFALALGAGAAAQQNVRLATAAGEFYPLETEALKTAIAGYFNEITVPEPPGRLRAVIVPHSAFGFSGRIAAHAFKNLKPDTYDRVILLGPSHFTSFEGCSIPSVQAFVTPLGFAPLDPEAVRQACYSTLFSMRGVHYKKRSQYVPLHEREHSLEVPLPFLQYKLGLFRIVPILVSDLRGVNGVFSEHTIASVASTIGDIVTERTLIVVSSDFTHFGNDFSYRPFGEYIMESIDLLDNQAFALINDRHFHGFERYLEKTRNPICGASAIQVLMKLLPEHVTGTLLAYARSGEMTGNENRSVSYAAIAFYDSALPPLEPVAPAPEEFPVGVPAHSGPAPLISNVPQPNAVPIDPGTLKEGGAP